MHEYFLQLAILVGIYLILAQSLNLVFGAGRCFNLAHVATYSIGAYSTALLSTRDPALGFVPCILTSMLLSGLFAILLGAIALRLSEEYFAIGTLSFAAIVHALLINWKDLTHGVLGIPGIPRPVVWGYQFDQNWAFCVLLYAFVVPSQLLFFALLRGRLGRFLRAQGEYEQAAQALGIDTRLVRNLAFLCAASFSGLAGAFFAYHIRFIDPSSFVLNEMVFVLTIVVLGRPGSAAGVVLACVFLVLLPEPLRFIEIPSSVLGPVRQLLYALVLFAVVYQRRAHLFPIQRSI
jgi:branched-chain amino acid transport system permease protein